MINIKLFDKDKNVIKGRVLAATIYSWGTLEPYNRHVHTMSSIGTAAVKGAYEKYIKESLSLTTTQVLPSRINKDNVREFGKYDNYHNHGFFVDFKKYNTSKREGTSYFLTIYKNHFENTVIMYLNENDVSKLKDIKINYSAMCRTKERELFKPCNESY